MQHTFKNVSKSGENPFLHPSEMTSSSSDSDPFSSTYRTPIVYPSIPTRSHLPTRLAESDPPPPSRSPLPVPIHDFTSPRSDSPHLITVLPLSEPESTLKLTLGGTNNQSRRWLAFYGDRGSALPSPPPPAAPARERESHESHRSETRFTIGEDVYAYNGLKDEKRKHRNRKDVKKPIGKYIAWIMIILLIATAVGVSVGLTLRANSRSSNSVVEGYTDFSEPPNPPSASSSPTSSVPAAVTSDTTNSESAVVVMTTTKDPAFATGLLTVASSTPTPASTSITTTRASSTISPSSTSKTKSTEKARERKRKLGKRLR